MKKLKLTDLVDRSQLQEIQDRLSAMTGLPMGMVDPDGNDITERSGLTHFCELLLGTEKGFKKCIEATKENIATKPGKVNSYECYAGLWHLNTPIAIEGEVIGIIVIGNMLREKLGKGHVERLAEEYGLDKGELWEASKDLRRYNEEEAENVVRLLATISSTLSKQASYAAKLREYSEQLEKKVKIRTEELKETKDFLSSIVNGSADSIITTNLEGKITTWNRGAEEIFGYKAEDMIGRPIDELYPPELKKIRKRWQKRIMKGETIRNQRTKVYNSAGELVDINLTLSPLRDKDGKPMGTVGVAKDIQRAVKLEQEIIEAKNMAEFFNDLMSHDINNANTVAIGILEELKDSLALDEEQEKLFDKSLYAIRRSSRLIDSVKMLQQVREVGEESFKTRDLAPILEEVIRDAILLHRDKYVRINYSPKETLIYTDDLVKDLFFNLLDNAVKYDLSDNVIIDISVEDAGKNWKVGIIDRGRGVPDEMKEAIFERYERIDEGVKGSGIGLHLVKVLVERYGGKAWVEDRVKGDHKKGSIFYVALPKGDASKTQ